MKSTVLSSQLSTVMAAFFMLLAQICMANTGFIKGLSDDEIEVLVEARELATKDAERIAAYGVKLGEYASRLSNLELKMPSGIEELRALQAQHENFLDDTLDSAERLLEKLEKKYDANNALELRIKLDEAINPEQAVGVRREVAFQDGTFTRSVPSIRKFSTILENRVEDAEQLAAETAERLRAKVAKFQPHTYSGGDRDKIIAEAKQAVIVSQPKPREIINISVVSEWHDGVHVINRIPYRTIKASVAYADSDDDGLCHFSAVRFISDDGAPLRYKAVVAGGPYEGLAECDQAAEVNGGLVGTSGGSLLGSLLWLCLVVVNLLGGFFLVREKLPQLPALAPVWQKMEQHASSFGVVAIAIAVAGFLFETMSLSLLHNLLPQLSATMLGLLIGAQFIAGQQHKAAQVIDKLQPFTHPLAIAGMSMGVLHLLLGGNFYFI